MIYHMYRTLDVVVDTYVDCVVGNRLLFFLLDCNQLQQNTKHNADEDDRRPDDGSPDHSV